MVNAVFCALFLTSCQIKTLSRGMTDQVKNLPYRKVCPLWADRCSMVSSTGVSALSHQNQKTCSKHTAFMLCQILQPQRASLPRCLLRSCVISQERTVSAKSKNLFLFFFFFSSPECTKSAKGYFCCFWFLHWYTEKLSAAVLLTPALTSCYVDDNVPESGWSVFLCLNFSTHIIKQWMFAQRHRLEVQGSKGSPCMAHCLIISRAHKNPISDFKGITLRSCAMSSYTPELMAIWP